MSDILKGSKIILTYCVVFRFIDWLVVIFLKLIADCYEITFAIEEIFSPLSH
jgi:hypothetical protein